MTILKTIVAGILAGLAIFLMPHILIKIIVIMILFKLAFKLLGFGCCGHGGHHRFKNMTEEERTAFMEKYGSKCCASDQKPTETKA